MNSGREKMMVIELDETFRQRLSALLREAGYNVIAPEADQHGLQQVLAFEPDLLLLGAEPPELDCCNLLSELKGSPVTNGTHVIMLASGGPAERARGLDLGADDVISHPWDSAELLARVRAQLRLKHTQDEARKQARIAEEGQQTAHTAFHALAVTDETKARTAVRRASYTASDCAHGRGCRTAPRA